MLFFPLITVKMPTIFGILTFMSRKNFMLSKVEHEKSFITSGPGLPYSFLIFLVRSIDKETTTPGDPALAFSFLSHSS